MNELDQIGDLIINKLSIFWFLGTLLLISLYKLQERQKTRLKNFIRLHGYRPDFEHLERDGQKLFETKYVDQEINREIDYIKNKSHSLGIEYKDDGFAYCLIKDSKVIACNYGLDIISFKISEMLDNKISN